MSDLMVLKAQQFINSTYNKGATLGIAAVPENGNTSWTVMYALTRALQHELGITNLSDGFGPTTLSTFANKVSRYQCKYKNPRKYPQNYPIRSLLQRLRRRKNRRDV